MPLKKREGTKSHLPRLAEKVPNSTAVNFVMDFAKKKAFTAVRNGVKRGHACL